MNNQIEKYRGKALMNANKLKSLANRHRLIIHNGLLVLAIALLLTVTTYAAFHTSYTISTGSDSILATELFSKGLQGHTVILSGVHSNLLMIPLWYIQGHLPYHYTSFTLVNIGLVLVTICAWAYLLIKLFGRKWELLILLLLSTLIFTSVTFNLNIAYTTIRNIEYPIALWFVMIVARLLKQIKYSRKEIALSALGSLLFCIVVAGDSFFSYAILLPLVLVIAWYWIQSREFTLNMLKALGLVTGIFIGAALLKILIAATGIIFFSNSYIEASSILPTNELAPSITIALNQLLQLSGATIFGQAVSFHNLAIFINFGLLILGTVGLVVIITKGSRNFRNRKRLVDGNNFVFIAMAVSYFTIFTIYILSGFVVTRLANGQIVSWQNERYISFMPLISIIGFVWLLKNFYKKHGTLLFLMAIILVVCLISSYSNTSSSYKVAAQQENVSRFSIINIITVLKHNDVHEVLTDYEYGPPIRFWSSNSINYAPQTGCDNSFPFNVREDWFMPQKGIKSALIIDHSGWGCTNEQLVRIYGKPIKRISAPGMTTNSTIDIWIYNYDVRQHLLPFPITN